MDFELPSELRALQARTREFIATQVLPLEKEQGPHEHGPSEALRTELVARARQAGLFTPHASLQMGGLGLSHIAKAVVFEEAGYSSLGPVALNIHAPDEGNIHLMEQVASAAQKDRRLRPQPAGFRANPRGGARVLARSSSGAWPSRAKGVPFTTNCCCKACFVTIRATATRLALPRRLKRSLTTWSRCAASNSASSGHAVNPLAAETAGNFSNLDALVAEGVITATPITYEDFLPVSAAGILQSNLGADRTKEYSAGASQAEFEQALSVCVLDEMALYQPAQDASIARVMRHLQESAR